MACTVLENYLNIQQNPVNEMMLPCVDASPSHSFYTQRLACTYTRLRMYAQLAHLVENMCIHGALAAPFL